MRGGLIRVWCLESVVRRTLPETFELLYIGIAPSRETCAGESPVAARPSAHRRKRRGVDVPLLSLASLLYDEQDWRPFRSPSGKCRLSREHNQALSAWQQAHLRVSWVEVARPWHVEADVVKLAAPPMNREHNGQHDFYVSMGDARNRFRQAAAQGGGGPV